MKKAIAAILALSVSFVLFAYGISSDEVFRRPLDRSNGDFVRVEQGFSSSPLVASYTQTRTISRLNKSLASSGTMIIKPGAGIAWAAKEPYESLLVVGLESMYQKVGSRTASMDVSNNQIYLAIAKALDGLFSGDFLSVEAAFSAYFISESGEWTIGLIPKENAMKAAIASIAMSGSIEGGRAVIGSLIMKEASGDSILYEFSNLEMRELKDNEEAVFSF